MGYQEKFSQIYKRLVKMKIQVLYDELAHHQHLPQLQHQKTGFEYWPKSILIRNRPLGKENRES